MDNKAIEAAARAMYERFSRANGNAHPNWDKATPRARESFIADAQAAIDAWREAGGK